MTNDASISDVSAKLANLRERKHASQDCLVSGGQGISNSRLALPLVRSWLAFRRAFKSRSRSP